MAVDLQGLRNLMSSVARDAIDVLGGPHFRAGYTAFQPVGGDRPDPSVITAAIVKGLANPDFLVEMDAVAVVPA